jgi:hypothetical protein
MVGISFYAILQICIISITKNSTDLLGSQKMCYPFPFLKGEKTG